MKYNFVAPLKCLSCQKSRNIIRKYKVAIDAIDETHIEILKPRNDSLAKRSF